MIDRGVWYGNSYSDPAGDQSESQAAYRYPRNRFGEFSSVWNSTWYNVTGYWAKKLVALRSAFTGSDNVSFYSVPFPDMRYADLLLMAAEAWNEAEETPNEKVYDWKVLKKHTLNMQVRNIKTILPINLRCGILFIVNGRWNCHVRDLTIGILVVGRQQRKN